MVITKDWKVMRGQCLLRKGYDDVFYVFYDDLDDHDTTHTPASVRGVC